VRTHLIATIAIVGLAIPTLAHTQQRCGYVSVNLQSFWVCQDTPIQTNAVQGVDWRVLAGADVGGSWRSMYEADRHTADMRARQLEAERQRIELERQRLELEAMRRAIAAQEALKP
jgi:hypothetical protein